MTGIRLDGSLLFAPEDVLLRRRPVICLATG